MAGDGQERRSYGRRLRTRAPGGGANRLPARRRIPRGGRNRDGGRGRALFPALRADDQYPMNTQLETAKSIETGAEIAIGRARARLIDMQARDGHWCGELTADTTLESDYVLFQLWLHPPRGGHWDPPTRPLIEKAVRSIFDRQLDDGGFNIYAEGPSEVSASVKAYVALKLAGVDGDDPRMARL